MNDKNICCGGHYFCHLEPISRVYVLFSNYDSFLAFNWVAFAVLNTWLVQLDMLRISFHRKDKWLLRVRVGIVLTQILRIVDIEESL